jgi:hypothetical protein
MIIGTLANGWNIIAVPADPPAPMTVDWNIDDMIGEVDSPYSGQGQQQDWMTDWWMGHVAMAPMPQAQAMAWIAFLAELRGRLNAFVLSDPLSPAPQGAGLAGTPNGIYAQGAQARARVIPTGGWKPSTMNQLLVGDFLQVGGLKNAQGQYVTAPRLHMVIGNNVNSDAYGLADINIWPSLREQVNSEDSIILQQTCGLFRLASNRRTWTIRRDKMYIVAFDVKEAL